MGESTTGERVCVEVAAAWPERQAVVPLDLPAGSTVADAIRASGLEQRFPDLEIRADHVGIFGVLCEPERVLADGDRVELYRPLKLDPKEVRRLNAQRRND